MKKKIILGILLLTLFSTIKPNIKFEIPNLNLKKIVIKNNFFSKDKEIKRSLSRFYNKNLVFLKNNDIEQALMKDSFIESFKIKKKYPDTLIIEIFEKKPIAILLSGKNKFYISEKIDLIKFDNIEYFEDLPYVIGNKDDFEKLYKNLKKINFPLDIIKKYTLYNSKRWDLETTNKIVIKLPQKYYTESLKNYLNLRDKNNLKKYKIFDYRLKDQLILK
tara:strand:+ start:459 stop:1115 length:657 start_codon:yes stop_codon:yes gene_type:complete